MQKISLLVTILIFASVSLYCQNEKEYFLNESNALLEINNDPFANLILLKIKSAGNFSTYSSSACADRDSKDKANELYPKIHFILFHMDSISDQNNWNELNDKVKEMHTLFVSEKDNQGRNCGDIQLITLGILDKLYTKQYEEYIDVQDESSYIDLLIDLNNEDYDELAEHIDALYGKISNEEFLRFIAYLYPKAELVINHYEQEKEAMKVAVESAIDQKEKIIKLEYYSRKYTTYKSAEYAISLLEKYVFD